MKLGIIGFPQSGKTTIFNALTRGDQPVAIGGGRFEVHTAVVDVPDPRVDRAVHLVKSHESDQSWSPAWGWLRSNSSSCSMRSL